MRFKKVSGERLVAAIIDSILVGILAIIPMVFFFISDGLEALSDVYIDGAGGVQGGDGYNTFTSVSAIAGTVIGVIYFCYIPSIWNGQTLGKRIMNIKAIDEFGNNPTFKQHLIRGIQNWSSFASLVTLPLLYINLMLFSVFGGLLSSLASLLVFASFIMILVKEDGRGLHDMIANTYVVKADIDLDKAFVEKTTQMSEWADVNYGDEETKEDDDWFNKPTDTKFKDEEDEDPWKY